MGKKLLYYDPLLHDDYPLPEMGISWENFVFGASVTSHFGSVNSRFIECTAWDAVYRADGPTYKLSTIVPDAFVEKWFLKTTWDSASLIAEGALKVPSVDRSMSVMVMLRLVDDEKCPIYYCDGRSTGRFAGGERSLLQDSRTWIS